MTAACQPFPRSVIEDFLQDAVRTLCDRPGDTPAQKEGRAHRLVHTTLGFQPRDGLEYMLATLAQGHYDLMLDSMRDVFQGQIDSMKAKTKAGIVGLGRSMRGLLTDLRRAGARPLTAEAQREEDARRAEEARRAEAAAAPMPAARRAASPAPASPAAASPDAAVPANGSPARAGAARPAAPAATRPPVSSPDDPAAAPAGLSRLPPVPEADPSPEAKPAARHESWAAPSETLARAQERDREGARAASGD